MGNDPAHELAKRGSDTTVCEPEPLLPLSQALIKTWRRANTERKQKTEWRNNEGCKQTKNAVAVASKRQASNLIRLTRHDLRKVIGILAGHSPIKKFIHYRCNKQLSVL